MDDSLRQSIGRVEGEIDLYVAHCDSDEPDMFAADLKAIIAAVELAEPVASAAYQQWIGWGDIFGECVFCGMENDRTQGRDAKHLAQEFTNPCPMAVYVAELTKRKWEEAVVATATSQEKEKP